MLTRQGRPLRVLVVEDHALIALDLEMMIDDLGGEVVGVTALGEQAAPLAQSLRPDLVLMDVRLAGVVDGVDAAPAVAAVPGTNLIFITGNADPGTMERIRRAGDFRVLAKPVMPDDLAAAFRAVCDLDDGAR